MDKWLQVARVFKTRSQATRACNLGRVRINGNPAKPHRNLALGDRIEVSVTRDWKRELIVRELRDRPVPKERAADLFEDLSPPRPQPDAFERARRAPAARREKGQGRPTKRERRALDRLRER